MKNNKSFATPSAKPVDVEYRLKRLRSTLQEAEMFLLSIDPSVFPGHSEVRDQLDGIRCTVAGVKAPAKKARASAEAKAAKATALEAAKAAKAAAREAAKAEKTAAKAKPEPKVKAVKAKTELKADVAVAKPAAGSAIERALAAAKARQATKAALQA